MIFWILIMNIYTYISIITTKYNNIGDINNPPKWDTKVITMLVDKSACANRHNTKLVLNGGGMQ